MKRIYLPCRKGNNMYCCQFPVEDNCRILFNAMKAKTMHYHEQISVYMSSFCLLFILCNFFLRLVIVLFDFFKWQGEEDMFMASLICNIGVDCQTYLVCKTDLECVKTLHFDTEVDLGFKFLNLLLYQILFLFVPIWCPDNVHVSEKMCLFGPIILKIIE